MPAGVLALLRLLSLLRWADGLPASEVRPPQPGRQGLGLGTWLGPQDVLGRPRLERVLVLSALAGGTGWILFSAAKRQLLGGQGGPAWLQPPAPAPAPQGDALRRSSMSLLLPTALFLCSSPAELGSKVCFLSNQRLFIFSGTYCSLGSTELASRGRRQRSPGSPEALGFLVTPPQEPLSV